MSDEVNSLNELAERLFSKPPVLQVGCTCVVCYFLPHGPPQGIGGPGVTQYVNACVDDIEEGLVRQLLNSELCTTERDLKEFVGNTHGRECIQRLPSMVVLLPRTE